MLVVAAVLYSEHHWFAIDSELEVPGARTATWLRTTDVLCGGLVLTLPGVLRVDLPQAEWRKWALAMTAIVAVTGAAAGLILLS
jgi:hypothetical protein